jgi:multiple sugar transport system substrate-binding protein
VNIVYVDWSVYNQKIATSFAAGTAPDILQTGASYVPDLVAKNQIRSIDAYLPSWGHKNDFYPGAWEDTVWQGHNYGVPYLPGTDALVYRKSMLAAAGISHPPTTWDELYADAVKLTKKDASGHVTQLGYQSFTGGDPINFFNQWLILYFSEGGTLATHDGKHALIDTPAGVAAAAFYTKLFQAMTPGGVGLSSKLVAPFSSGRLAMEIQQESIASEVLQYNPKILNDVGVAKPLLGPGAHARHVALVFSDWLAITTQSKNPDAAWKWVTFATQPKYLADYDKTCQYPPPNKIAVKASWVESNPIFKQFSVNVYPYGQAFPFFPHIVELWEKVGAEIGKAAYGQETVAQAMKNAQAQADALLSGTSTH